MGIAFRITLFFAVISLLADSWESMKRYIPGEKLAFQELVEILSFA